MAKQGQKTSTGSSVRIWNEEKELVQELKGDIEIRERRNVSEAEVVSKAVRTLYNKEKKKLAQKETAHA